MDIVGTAAALGRVLGTVLQHQLSLDQSVALRSSAVRPGEDSAGIYGPVAIERPDRCLAAVGQPAITQKSELDIPGILAVSEDRSAVLDNSVQNRLGF